MQIVKSVLVIYSPIVLATACTHQRAGPTDQQNPIARTSAIVDSTSAHPDLPSVYSPGYVRYSYHGTAVIHSIAGDSIPRVDSSRITAVLSATFQAPVGQRTQVTTRADSLQVVTLPNTSITQTVESWPNSEWILTIDSRNSQVQLINEPVPRTCGHETRESPLRGNEIVPVISPEAPKRQSWSDTATYRICRGGIEFVVGQMTHYRVLASGAETGISYSLLRTSESQLTGSGLQWQQAVHATGRSLGVDTLLIDRATGRLSRITGTARLEMKFQSARRNQEFFQQTQTEIVLQ